MTVQEIMQKAISGEITADEAAQMVADCQPKRQEREPSVKVNPKGTISVYGLQRFPVSLYPEQWDRLLNIGDKIRAGFDAANANIKTYVAPAKDAA